MEAIQSYLVLGLLGSYVSGVFVFFLTFTLWICSLKSELNVYAPLVDGAWGKVPSNYENKGVNLTWPKARPRCEAHLALKMKLLPIKSNHE